VYEPSGSWVAIATPFKEDESIDFAVFERLVEFHAANGSSAILVMGSTGEPTLLTGEERREIIDRVTGFARGKIPVFFGTTCGSTRETIALTRYAEDKGADGVVLVVPPYVTPPQEAIFEHFAMVATSVKFPVALYNNPTRVRVNIEPTTIARLHREAPNLSIDKEAMGDVSQIADVIALTGGAVRVLCCDYPKYGLIMPTLALGGVGIAGITGNVAPAEFAELARPWSGGTDIEACRREYFRLLPLMKAMYWLANPIVVKAALNLLGIPVGRPRRPLTELTGPKLDELDALMNDFQLKERYARWTKRPNLHTVGV
jgi:4-hydroxy-tetrahydrodipicolinate synthase